MIRAISLKKSEREFPELEQAIPHRYLIEIMETAKKVEEGAE